MVMKFQKYLNNYNLEYDLKLSDVTNRDYY